LRIWYARVKTFLLEHGYVIGSVDKTLFTLKHGNNFLLEGSEKATRGGVNESQSKFLEGTWPISQTETNTPLF
jgi:hypothetical protein